MTNMLHMRLVWKIDPSSFGCDIKTDAGPGGPLFHICRVGTCLCNDDDGRETAAAIARSHNDALKHELRQAYRDLWQNDLPEDVAFYVTRKGMTLVKFDAGYARKGRIFISSGELLAHDRTGGKRKAAAEILVTVGGLRGMLPHTSIRQIIDDGILANC